ncbi:MAG: twin-arginine translocation signal domain-containing protein [Gemmatimonadetes bacterium]|nr:twin-arginine translocation signal domain-containing protein [Gemmatimonadota bacterium]
MTTRRDFVRLTAAGGVLGAGLPFDLHALGIGRRSAAIEPAPRALRLLILGGTGFTGPHQVRYAVARGHTVTVFNRGRRQADLPDGVEHLVGDRNDDLKALEGREWDVVIDNPTTLPNWVRLSGKLLKDACNQYIFISTISVYADNSVVGMDEATPVLEYQGEASPFTLPIQEAGRHYGALKALSERETAYWFPGRVTIIRPGLIVGPGDETDRFTYWPVRIARGGEVLAPGTPADPTQIIDARDLAEWTIRMAENGEVGVYNATGPDQPRPIGEMLNSVRSAIGSSATLTWVDQSFLQAQQVRGWSDMPVWVQLSDQNRAFMQVSVERAKAKGLTYRPLAQTASDTLAWFRTLPAERQATLRVGIKPEREAEVLAAWKAR